MTSVRERELGRSHQGGSREVVQFSGAADADARSGMERSDSVGGAALRTGTALRAITDHESPDCSHHG